MRLHRERKRSGQGAVEMALVLPILLLLVVGAIEFGRAWRLRQVVTDAARAGARLAVLQNPLITKDSVRVGIQLALSQAGVDSSNMTIVFDTLEPPAGHWRETGSMQVVSVQCQFQFGFFGPIFQAVAGDDEITIASVVNMRNE